VVLTENQSLCRAGSLSVVKRKSVSGGRC